MAAAIDMYNSSRNSVFSDSSREELMKALDPFMKSSSSTFPLSSSSSSSSCSYSQLTPSQPYMDPEFCSPSSSNHLFPNHGFFNYNNLMGFEHTGSTSPTSSIKELMFPGNLVASSLSIPLLMQSSRPFVRACRSKRIQQRPLLFLIQNLRWSLITV